jgi:branched-chain amino acid transport system permease protein
MNTVQKLRKNIVAFIVLALLFVLPFVVPNPYITSTMVYVAINGILALGMGVLLNYSGLFTVVQPVFLGIGAYTAAILSLAGVSPVLGIIAGGVVVAIIAFLIGAPVLRLRGFYLALSSFAILLAANIFFIQAKGITGGPDGLSGIPPLSVAGFVLKGDTTFYYLTWALCIACLLVSMNIINSRPGRALQAARDSEIGAASLGVNIPRYQLQIFVVTSVMAGLAGGFFCFYLRYVAPPLYSYDLLINVLLMTVIGGIGRIWAPLLGCFVITWLDEFMRAYLGSILPIMTGQVTAIFYALIIIIIMIFAPFGLVGMIDETKRFFKRVFRSGHSA